MDRLEEKLDGLVTLLKSATQPGPSSKGSGPQLASGVQDQLTPESLQSLAPTPANVAPNDSEDFCVDKEPDLRYCPGGGLSLHVPVINPDTPYAASGTRSSTYHSSDASVALKFEPSVEEAEAYLQAYRETKSPYFPLVLLPALNAQQFRQERPFLWLCIMAVSSNNSEQQQALGKEIRLTIGREMLLEGKNNVDLLLGLLIYTAWCVIILNSAGSWALQ